MKYADLVWDHDEAAHAKFVANLAPIVLFTYNRLDHTRQTVEALRQNVYAADSRLYIFSDGARNEQAEPQVQAVREYLHTVDGFKEITYVEREENWGLARNIIDGVTKIVNQYGKIIVVEDDIVTSKWFLKFMNDALEVYRDIPKVMSISAFTDPVEDKSAFHETFFLSHPGCWGWATWQRVWKNYERNPQKCIEQFSVEDIDRFNMHGAYDYWSQVTANAEGTLFTWAIFMDALVFKHNGVNLYSKETLSRNCGFDGTGEHCGEDEDYSHMTVTDQPVEQFVIDPIELDEQAEHCLEVFYRKRSTPKPLLHRVLNVYRKEGWGGICKRVKKRIVPLKNK